MEHLLYLKIENDIRSVKVKPVKHPIHQVYHVLFEDGYENIFFTDVETGNWIEEDLGETALAVSFGLKIDLLDKVYIRPCRPLAWCRASIADMIVNFGFYSYTENDNTVFEVYTDNHKFLCNLVRDKKNNWTMYGSQKPVTAYQYVNKVQVITSIFEGMADKK